MSYDSRCYDLAALFLLDNPEKNTEANREVVSEEMGSIICRVPKPNGAVNAAFIVKAVNNHDALVTALLEIAAFPGSQGEIARDALGVVGGSKDA